jgi:hypothetical protein
MPLKGRVGRHASDGRQCQNWKSDQQTVIDLLNRIPVTDGGTAGNLGGRVVAGIASTALYQAILAFENKHFPGKAKGFVDPGGVVLAKLETLANRPPPAPKPANKWDVLTTQSVRQALKQGVADKKLSHADAINIVRSTLSDGYITQEEINDLRAVAQRSATLEIRSVRLLNHLATTLDFGADQGKPLELRSDAQKRAAEIVCKFMEGENNSHWRYLDRYQVGASLLMRIANPGAIDQKSTSLCAAAAVFFGLAKDNPVEYAQFAIELFESGKAVLGGKRIEPHPYMKAVDISGKIDQADWMILGSLRSSENYYTAYWSPNDDLTAATEPGKISDWLKLAGYSDVRQETNLVRSKGENNLREASRLYAAGYLTLLFIEAGMLYKASQSKNAIGEWHWVVLTDKVQIANDKSVNLKIYTWGDGKRTVPEDPGTPLALSDFLQNYHGFVAGRPW